MMLWGSVSRRRNVALTFSISVPVLPRAPRSAVFTCQTFCGRCRLRRHGGTHAPKDRKVSACIRFTSSGRNETMTADTNMTTSAREALLVVDHGSKRTAANDMLLEIADMLRKRSNIPVYTAHMELAAPSIADGIRKCVADGATHVIVVPFFLSPGRHSITDIPQLTKDAAEDHPSVTYEVRPPIGTHPGIADIILDRAGLL